MATNTPMNPITTARWIYQCICEDDYNLALAHTDALAEYYQDEGGAITQRVVDFLKQAISTLEHMHWQHPMHRTLFAAITLLINEREDGQGAPSRPVPIVDNFPAIARAIRRIEREG